MGGERNYSLRTLYPELGRRRSILVGEKRSNLRPLTTGVGKPEICRSQTVLYSLKRNCSAQRFMGRVSLRNSLYGFSPMEPSNTTTLSSGGFQCTGWTDGSCSEETHRWRNLTTTFPFALPVQDSQTVGNTSQKEKSSFIPSSA